MKVCTVWPKVDTKKTDFSSHSFVETIAVVHRSSLCQTSLQQGAGFRRMVFLNYDNIPPLGKQHGMVSEKLTVRSFSNMHLTFSSS